MAFNRLPSGPAGHSTGPGYLPWKGGDEKKSGYKTAEGFVRVVFVFFC
jgi:hypothetical protein